MEAERLQVPAGPPQSQEVALPPVLHLPVLTETPLTAGLPLLPQLETEAVPAGSLAMHQVTPPVSRPPEVRRLRLTAALAVAGRVDQQLLARLTEPVLGRGPGDHTALTAGREREVAELRRELHLTEVRGCRGAGTGPGPAGDLVAPHHEPLLSLTGSSLQQVVALAVPRPVNFPLSQAGRLVSRHRPAEREAPLVLAAGAGDHLPAGRGQILKCRAEDDAVTSYEDFVLPTRAPSLQSVALEVGRPQHLVSSTLDGG